MDPLRNTGTTRPREAVPELNDFSSRRVRPRMGEPEDGALSPRRVMAGDMEAGPSSLAPRAAMTARPTLPDLNAIPPGSPQAMLQGLNATPPGLPQVAWLDLNAMPPRSPQPDLRPLPDSVLTAFDIRGAPQPADVFRLVDRVAREPALESNILSAAGELVGMLGISSELRDGLESRYGEQADPITNRVIEQLLEDLDDIADYDIDSEQESDAVDGLEVDLGEQNVPLGDEIQAWLRGADARTGPLHAFDAESNAASFARMLARLRAERDEGSSGVAERLAAQVPSVIEAITGDAALRARVFVIAETALGSCSDNLAEGFSNVLLATRNHQMAQDVERGQVDAAQLNRWAGQQFRLSLLEDAVNRFIGQQLQRPDLPHRQRAALTREPLETMVHAKVALRDRLHLPDSTVSTMTFHGFSALGQEDLGRLEREVSIQATDPVAHGEALLANPTWRVGMKALHAQAFEELARARDEDEFFDLDVPANLEGQVRYAERAREVEAKWKGAEDELLRRLANEVR